jgi:hypothetical protein
VMGIPARVFMEIWLRSRRSKAGDKVELLSRLTRAHISCSTRNKWVLVQLKMECSEQEIWNMVRPQLDQVCLLHGVRIVEKGNREVAELDLHVLEIVVLLLWLVVVSMLGMNRKESGYSTLHISHRRGNLNRGGFHHRAGLRRRLL